MAQQRQEDPTTKRAQPHPLIRGAQASSNSILGVAWEYADIVPDYQVGVSSGILFLRQEEVARYLETYKAFEQRPPDMIRTRVGDSYADQLTAVLTSWAYVDQLTKSLANMARAPHESFSMLPGMGEVKVENLSKAFKQPFRTDFAYRKAGKQAGKQAEPTSIATTDNEQANSIPATESIDITDQPDSPAQATTDPLGEALHDTSSRAIEGLPDNFEDLPEEEQLRLAMEMSVNGFT